MTLARCIVALTALSLSSGDALAKAVASVEHARDGASLDVILIVKYSNTGNDDVSIREADLPRTMPDGRLWNNAFQVISSAGSSAPYTGVVVNLSPEARTSRITLKPGDETVIEVNLSKNYRLQPNTHYQVTPRGFEQSRPNGLQQNHSRHPDGDTSIYTESPSILLKTDAAPSRDSGSTANDHLHPRATCPPDKTLAVTQALPIAAQIARGAQEYVEGLYELNLGPDGTYLTFNQTPRYTTWFGIHGDPNVPNPTNLRIKEVLSSSASRFGMLSPPSCNCPDSIADRVIAWVDPDSAHVINYCPKFFKLPIGPGIATGSKSRTIFHEVTHFNDFLAKGADDYEAHFALPEDARKLAVDARDLTSNHSYSFEYFVDNLDSQE